MKLCVISWLIVSSMVINVTSGNKLKFNANIGTNPNIRQNIADVMPLFDSSVFLCAISNNNDILEIFIDNIKNKNKTISLIGIGQNYASCDAFILFDIYITDCQDILLDRFKYLYFINHKLTPEFDKLEKCFIDSLVYEIVTISLQGRGIIHRLHNGESLTRYFKRSSVEEVLVFRKKVKKINLKGKEIKVGYDPNPPYIITIPDGNKTELDGLEYLLMKELSRQLNFTIKFVQYKDWGTVGTRGVWENGLFEGVVKGEAELALTAIWMVKSIYNSVDFGPSLNRVKIAFLVRRPETIEFQWKHLLTVFRAEVWAIILILFAIVIAVYWVAIKNYHPEDQRTRWIGCFLTIFGITIQTSYPRGKIARFASYILTSWSFFSLLLTTLLSGNVFCGCVLNILLILTLPQYSSRVDTIKQLVEGQYYWTVQYYARFNSTEMKKDIFNFENPWVSKFEKRYKYMNSQEVYEIAYNDKRVAFLTESFGTDLIFVDIYGLQGHKALRDFRMMKEEVTSTHLSFGVAKNSPLLEPITTMALYLQEAGMNVRWRDRVLKRWPIYDTRHLMVETDITSFSEPHELVLNKLQPVFYLLLFGLTIASLVFALEVIW